ncbi:MAG: DUF262 domain-containing protein [Candidatus Puniceispirillaceae bacterium]
MSYNTDKTIAELLDLIGKNELVLPAIQREFVWKTEQIESFLDSLMQGYPTGVFLFWNISEDDKKEFEFYRFHKKYSEKEPHNQDADLWVINKPIAVLDGQQRLTALSIALRGTYASRTKGAWKKFKENYPERKLYLNLIGDPVDSEFKYDFKFMKPEDVSNNASALWFECMEILEIKTSGTASETARNMMENQKYSKEDESKAQNTLTDFSNLIHDKKPISYFAVKEKSLDEVLQIFVRTNSGGTPLSHSDLLLSMATAQWNGENARELIHTFVDNLNNVGGKFSFDKDFVLKSCLVLSDLNVKFNIQNFSKKNIEKIESKWSDISDSIENAVKLVSYFGYTAQNLTSNNAVIPIAYFIHKREMGEKILEAARHEQSRKHIKNWLARVLVNGVFGGNPDSVYPKMRNIINESTGDYPLEQIISAYKGERRSIHFSEENIEGLLKRKYGQEAFSVLTLLYPDLNYSQLFHQDHIHPKSAFTVSKLKKLGLSAEDIKTFQEKGDSLANLMLLSSTTNQEKNKKAFEDWVNERYPEEDKRHKFFESHYIDSDQSLAFKDFLSFIENREKKIQRELKKVLDISG